MPEKFLPLDGSSFFAVVVRKQKQRAGRTQDFTFDHRADRQIRRFGLHDSHCRLADAPMWSADRQIRRFGLQTVKFDDFECSPFKFNDMECRPSNVQIDNTIRLELEHLFATMLIDGVQKLRPSEFRI